MSLRSPRKPCSIFMSDESLDIELEYVDDPMGLGDVADEFHQSIPESVVTEYVTNLFSPLISL